MMPKKPTLARFQSAEQRFWTSRKNCEEVVRGKVPHSRRPRRPPFLLVLSVGMGVTSSGRKVVWISVGEYCTHQYAQFSCLNEQGLAVRSEPQDPVAWTLCHQLPAFWCAGLWFRTPCSALQHLGQPAWRHKVRTHPYQPSPSSLQWLGKWFLFQKCRLRAEIL